MSGNTNNDEIPVSKPKKGMLERFFMSPAQKKARAALTAEIYALKDDFKKRLELSEILNMAYILNAWQDTLKVALDNKTINHKEYDKLFVKLEKRIKKFNTAIDEINKIQYLKPFTPFNQLIIRSILANHTIENNFGISPQSWVKLIVADPNLELKTIKSEILADPARSFTDRLALANEYFSTINAKKTLGVGAIDINDLIVNGVFASVGTTARNIIRGEESGIFCSAVLNILMSSRDMLANQSLLERALAGSAFYRWFKENYLNIDIKKLPEPALTALIDAATKTTVSDTSEMYKTAAMLNAIIEQAANNDVKLAAAKCMVTDTLKFVGTVCQDPDSELAAYPTMFTIPANHPEARQHFINAVQTIIELDKSLLLDPEAKPMLLQRAKDGACYEAPTKAFKRTT